MPDERGFEEAFIGFTEPLRPIAEVYARCIASAHQRLAALKEEHPELPTARVMKFLERLAADGHNGTFTHITESIPEHGMLVYGTADDQLETDGDQTVLEKLLGLNHETADAKIFAMALVAEFGCIDAVLSATDARIMMISGADHRLTDLMHLLRAIRSRAILEHARASRPIRSADQVFDYAVAAMAHLRRNQIRVLYLSRHQELIGVEVLQQGDIEDVIVYPSQVVKRCLDLGARYFVVLHSYMDGETEPDTDQLNQICKLEKAADGIGLSMIDYVLVGPYMCASLREQGLIGAEKPRYLWFKNGSVSSGRPAAWSTEQQT